MRGYVVEKGGRFYAVIYQGRDPITGRERRRPSDQRSCSPRLPRRRTAPEGSQSRDTSWTPGYLESRSTIDRAPRDGYQRNIERHVVPRSGASRSAASGATTSIPSMPELLANGRVDGKGGLDAKTVLWGRLGPPSRLPVVWLLVWRRRR
jgi:hypothetical protein